MAITRLNNNSASSITSLSGLTSLPSGLTDVNTPVFTAYMTSNQTSFPQGTWTKIQFNSTFIDTDSAFNTSTHRFVVPSGKGGKYFIHGQVHYFGFGGGNTNNDAYYAMIYKNGVQGHLHQVGQEPDINYNGVAVAHIMDLVAGDYIELYGYTDQQTGTGDISGGTGPDHRTFFEGFKLTD